MLREIEGKKRRGQQKMKWLDGITNSIHMRFSKLQDLVMEKAMTIHCSTLVWKIPWMEEPGRLQSMG